MSTPEVTLHHSPNTRSTGALILLEELGAPYQLHVMNMKAGENRQPAYLAIKPLGKVPAVTHGDALVTCRWRCSSTSPTCSRPTALRRRSATRCAGRTCAGWRSTARRSSRR